MTPPLTTCPHCGSADLYTHNVEAGGVHGPNLLSGLGGFLSFATFDVVLCATCGRCEFFADERARQNATTTWRRVAADGG
jgi:predicted nucleic-acid-binding Zn-ribbon protein